MKYILLTLACAALSACGGAAAQTGTDTALVIDSVAPASQSTQGSLNYGLATTHIGTSGGAVELAVGFQSKLTTSGWSPTFRSADEDINRVVRSINLTVRRGDEVIFAEEVGHISNYKVLTFSQHTGASDILFVEEASEFALVHIDDHPAAGNHVYSFDVSLGLILAGGGVSAGGSSYAQPSVNYPTLRAKELF